MDTYSQAAPTSEEVLLPTTSERDWHKWLFKASRWLFFAVAFLIPTWFLTSGGLDIARSSVFGILAFLSLALYLGYAMLTGRILYAKSPLNVAVLSFFVVAAFATYFSRVQIFSFLTSDMIAERMLVLISIGVLYFLTISLLRDRNDAILFFMLLVGGGALWGIIGLLGYFNIFVLPFSFAKSNVFSPTGSMNALGVLYGVFLISCIGFVLSMKEKIRTLPRSFQIGLFVAIAVFCLNLLVINFLNEWIMLLISGLFLGWLYMRARSKEEKFPDLYVYILGALIVLSIIFLFVRVPLFSWVQIPPDVTPNYQGTVTIVKKVFGEGALRTLFGSGPGTFGYDYALYHDPLINLTNFWGTRFNQGYSFLTTATATMGLLGLLSLLSIIVVFGLVCWKKIKSSASYDHPLFYATYGASLFLILSWVLYIESYTLLLVSFLMLGVMVAISSHEENGFWSGERFLDWKSSWSLFGASLIGFFIIICSFAGAYTYMQQYRAAIHLEKAVSFLQQGGNAEAAISELEAARKLDPYSDSYLRFLGQAHLLKIQGTINSAFAGDSSQTVRDEFQKQVTAAVDAVKKALEINPMEAFNWRTAGALYKTILPIVQGADQSALGAYAQAARLDPMNPLVFTELGQVYLDIADTTDLLATQQGVTQDRLKQLRDTKAQSLIQAGESFGQAVSVKEDFATAHFLLSQVALRQGNLQKAIASTEVTLTKAPNDVGVLFQLGLLYYQSGRFEESGAVLERAVQLSPNYSNARYFLGLILDRKGLKSEAIGQFQEIEKLNPGNQEVEKILQNLRAGKSALTNITPPPEKRKEVPIKEAGGNENTPIKK